MKRYLKSIQSAVSENMSEEHLKNITNAFLKQQLYSDAEFQINADNGKKSKTQMQIGYKIWEGHLCLILAK
jgi:hypothetical protein